MKVSFDYDYTLSRRAVRRYAKELISGGVDVWIVTSRFKDVDNYNFPTSHKDLYNDAMYAGIDRGKIVFTNMIDKAKFFADNQGFLFHLDDDAYEVGLINNYSDTKGILCLSHTNWKQECQEALRQSAR